VGRRPIRVAVATGAVLLVLALAQAPALAQDGEPEGDGYPPTSEGQYPPTAEGPGGGATTPADEVVDPSTTAGTGAPTADESSILPVVLVVAGIVVVLAGGAWAIRRAT
jgi:type IV secretory pathway TrbL component